MQADYNDGYFLLENAKTEPIITQLPTRHLSMANTWTMYVFG